MKALQGDDCPSHVRLLSEFSASSRCQLVGNYGQANVLLHNDGGMAFTRVASNLTAVDFTTCVSWADYNGDGWVDFRERSPSAPSPNSSDSTGMQVAATLPLFLLAH